MTADRKIGLTSTIDTEQFSFLGHPVALEIGKNGGRVPILNRLEDLNHYNGPGEFDVVVNFGPLFIHSGMRGSKATPSEMWSTENLPPNGIKILGLIDPVVKKAVDDISEIATTGSDEDATACNRYLKLNGQVYDAIKEATNVDPKSTKFLGLVRAGAVAGQMLGVSLQDQILIQTKRLRLKGVESGFVSVGISYFNNRDMVNLDGKRWLIGDPAGATYSSALANLIYLSYLGVKPEQVDIWNTVASHKGSLFALDGMKELGIKGQVIAGGYAPGMNEKYYLETPDGKPSVGDAGDWLNRFLDLKSIPNHFS